jgi:hypothetical protein
VMGGEGYLYLGASARPPYGTCVLELGGGGGLK